MTAADPDVARLVAIIRAHIAEDRRFPDECRRYDQLAAWLEQAATMPDPTPTAWPCPLCDAPIGVACFPPDHVEMAGRCHHWRGWSIAMTNLGDDLDDATPLDVCAPTCENGPAHAYRGACLGCPWRGPVVDSENLALEAAHDHTHPAWRRLPAVPSYTGDGSGGSGAPAERERRAAWLARVTACYPPGWFDVPYAPVVTRRRPMGTRHHLAVRPLPGYDLGVIVGGPDGDPKSWPPPDRRHPAGTTTQENRSMAATSTTTTSARTKIAACPECGLDVDLARGKVKDHPAKDRPAKGAGSKALCPGSGTKPAPTPAGEPGEPTVVAPTLETMLLEQARPSGAWSGAQAASIDPTLCDPDPNNPRGTLGDLTELSMSLIAAGMLEPVIVAPGPTDGRYTIVAGHRRIAAAVAAQLPEVPALIRSDLKPGSNLSLVAQIVENLHRLELSPVDEANAYALLRDLGMKQSDIAAAVGVNQGQVSKRLALLKLPDELAATVGDRLDVATAVEVTRLPAAARQAVVDELAKPGADPVDVVRRARAKADRDAEHQAIVDDLETRKVALVDFPTTWHWGRDREDRPLSTGPDGEGQPYGGARTIDVTYADHADQPCHGAAVSARDKVIYVCLDPTRHGYKTAADEADELEAGRRAADEAREAAAALQAAAEQARRAAAREVALADVKRPYMADVIAGWVIDSIDVADAGALDMADVVERVAEWSDLEDPAVALESMDNPDTGDVLRWQILELTETHGAQRFAYMVAIAGVDVLLDAPPYHRQLLAGLPLVRDHYNRLAELAGYELTDTDRALAEPVDHADEVRSSMPDDVPDGAIAWYAPDAAAVLEGDEARWVFDVAELDAMLAAGAAHRLVKLDVYPDTAGTDEENTSAEVLTDASLVDAADAAIAAADEANRATAAALAGDDGLPADPEFDVDADDATTHDGPPVDRGDDLVPGERCPASRRDFNTPGNANGIPCPRKCGALVDTTATGKVRDHDVPEAAP